ncbi:MAG: L,D-transpeptidase family protein [Candidatus Xenobia bacterium]
MLTGASLHAACGGRYPGRLTLRSGGGWRRAAAADDHGAAAADDHGAAAADGGVRRRVFGEADPAQRQHGRRGRRWSAALPERLDGDVTAMRNPRDGVVTVGRNDGDVMMYATPPPNIVAAAPARPGKPLSLMAFRDQMQLSQTARTLAAWTPAQANAVHALQSVDLFAHPMRVGDRGDAVYRFKQGLAIAVPGFQSDSDVFDVGTLTAVMQYQEAHGLPADGVVGARTYGVLWHDLFWIHHVAHDLVDPSIYKNLPPGMKLQVDTGTQRISLLDAQGHLIKQYPTSTGSAQFPTPHGSFHIQNIIEKPWWNPPPSKWAAHSHRTPPGPNNPVGNVKMNVVGAIFMHGVPPKEYASIGHESESHGCMRMFQNDAWQLHHIVKPGTSVEIR